MLSEDAETLLNALWNARTEGLLIMLRYLAKKAFRRWQLHLEKILER